MDKSDWGIIVGAILGFIGSVISTKLSYISTSDLFIVTAIILSFALAVFINKSGIQGVETTVRNNINNVNISVKGNRDAITTLIGILAKKDYISASDMGDIYAPLVRMEDTVKNPLTRDMVQRRRALTIKLQSGSITHGEAVELQEILETEREEAEKHNDNTALVVIILLLGLVMAFLLSSNNKKS